MPNKINKRQVAELFGLSKYKLYELIRDNRDIPFPGCVGTSKMSIFYRKEDVLAWGREIKIKIKIKTTVSKAVKPKFDNEMAMEFISCGQRKKFDRHGKSVHVHVYEQHCDCRPRAVDAYSSDPDDYAVHT